MRAGAVAAALVAAAFVLSGCQYLFGLNGLTPPPGASPDPGVFGSFDPGVGGSFGPGLFGSFDPGPDESLPPPIATYATGTASIAIDGTTTSLGHLTEPGLVYADLGAAISWTDGQGMYLQFYSDPTGTSIGDGFVELDRIADGRHLATIDQTGCVVKVTESGVKGLSGTASCKDLHWTDTMGGFDGFDPSPVPDATAFNAEITFQAAP